MLGFEYTSGYDPRKYPLHHHPRVGVGDERHLDIALAVPKWEGKDPWDNPRDVYPAQPPEMEDGNREPTDLEIGLYLEGDIESLMVLQCLLDDGQDPYPKPNIDVGIDPEKSLVEVIPPPPKEVEDEKVPIMEIGALESTKPQEGESDPAQCAYPERGYVIELRDPPDGRKGESHATYLSCFSGEGRRALLSPRNCVELRRYRKLLSNLRLAATPLSKRKTAGRLYEFSLGFLSTIRREPGAQDGRVKTPPPQDAWSSPSY